MTIDEIEKIMRCSNIPDNKQLEISFFIEDIISGSQELARSCQGHIKTIITLNSQIKKLKNDMQ
jgi:hypothetical protein